MNPIIKFSTLFGLLATEIAIEMAVHAKESSSTNYAPYIAIPVFIVGLIFVWRSFYKMRIPLEEASEQLPTMETKIAHVHK
jgi:K(+)-stimulated pyrophosphate-energized sodium pump